MQAVDQSQSSSVPFRALEGSNIYQVLDAWAKDENVELLWDSDNSFAVLETFETEAPFEAAVRDLLDQYRDNHVRPVATLHVDPTSQQKTLVVRVLNGA